MRTKRKPRNKGKRDQPRGTAAGELRIIGGRMRGSLLAYHGHQGTRPMKERVREAVFNLIGPRVKGKHAVDLFAGTGALGLEALSRGAAAATMIERHIPSVRVIGENITALQLTDEAKVVSADTFYWASHQLDSFCAEVRRPWCVFCSPPYDYYVERIEEVLQLLNVMLDRAPAESIFVVEADERFDISRLQQDWDVRDYPPAVVALHEIG